MRKWRCDDDLIFCKNSPSLASFECRLSVFQSRSVSRRFDWWRKIIWNFHWLREWLLWHLVWGAVWREIWIYVEIPCEKCKKIRIWTNVIAMHGNRMVFTVLKPTIHLKIKWLRAVAKFGRITCHKPDSIHKRLSSHPAPSPAPIVGPDKR